MIGEDEEDVGLALFGELGGSDGGGRSAVNIGYTKLAIGRSRELRHFAVIGYE